jgi:hypothetical protein
MQALKAEEQSQPPSFSIGGVIEGFKNAAKGAFGGK